MSIISQYMTWERDYTVSTEFRKTANITAVDVVDVLLPIVDKCTITVNIS